MRRKDGVPSCPRMAIDLTRQDREMLDGRRGEATALAMRIVVDMAGVWQADRLIDVTSAHVDSCLYHGRAGLDLAEKLLAGGAKRRGADDPERLFARPPPPRRSSGSTPTRRRGLVASWTRTWPWAAGRPGPARRISSNVVRRSASTSPGPSRTRSCSPTRCWAHGRTATATSSTSARPSPDGCRRPASTWTSTGEAGWCSGWRTTSRRACSPTRSHPRASVTSWGRIRERERACPSSSGSRPRRARID